MDELTSTESRVLFLVAEGMDTDQMTNLLCVSKRTAEFHLGNIAKKMGTPNRVQWLRRFCTWTPKAEAREVERKLVTLDCCVVCAKKSLDTVAVGVIFTVPMCPRCFRNLEAVREEARARMEAEADALMDTAEA